MTMRIRALTKRDSAGRLEHLEVLKGKARKGVELQFLYGADGFAREIEFTGKKEEMPSIPEIVALINEKFMERLGTIKMVNEVELIDLIDLIKKITTIGTIEEIKTITEIDSTAKLADGLIPGGFFITVGQSQKTANPLTTDYIKACIVPSYITTASPTGMMVSYEGGYICRALIYKAGSGEVALAKSCLDVWVSLQKADGSWSQQYYPYLNSSLSHDEYEDLQVPAGVGLLCWAMAAYDNVIGAGTSVIYKSAVQLAYNFLRAAQLALYNAVGSALFCNQRKAGVWNYAALAADCGEVLLATMAVLDQYGPTLLNQAGYSIATFGNDLYESIATLLYLGDAYQYYRTEYPADVSVWGLTTIKQQISFSQALCAWAVKLWAGKAYRTGSDYSAQAEKVIDKSVSLCMGKWGGFFYSPYFAAADEFRNEYPNYSALMAMSMSAVNSSKYAVQITRIKRFIQWAALDKGEVHDYVRPNSMMDIAPDDFYGFSSLVSAQGLLAGA